MCNHSLAGWMIACSLVCLVGGTARAREVNYVERFEGKENPVSFWTAGSTDKYEVNYAGLTTERAHSGKQSYKLDITFIGEGHYNYWAGPTLDIPAVPGMRLSGYIYVERYPPHVSVALGHSFYLPAVQIANPGSSGRGLCGPISTVRHSDAGKWIRLEADLGEVGDSMSRGALKQSTPGVRLEKWFIYMIPRHAANERLVVYIDDISIRGTVPDNYEEVSRIELAEWKDDYERRKAASGARFEKALASVRAELDEVMGGIPREDVLRPMQDHPWGAYARDLYQEIRRKAAELKKETLPGRQSPPSIPIRVADQPMEYIRNLRDTGLRPLRVAIANLEKLPDCAESFLLFVRDNPVTNYRVVHTTRMIDGAITDRMEAFASPGEYEPMTFFILPSRDTTVTFDVPDLRSGDNVIPASRLDLRLVKVWYQAGIDVGEISRRILTPELLLKDDDLVRVDHGQKINVVRDPDAPRDAAELLPVRIGRMEVRQFWLTVHVPENVPPGEYRGRLGINAQGLGRRDLAITLRVLPIQLAEPYLEYSIYYRGFLDAGRPAFVSSEQKTPEQLAAEFRDMKAHGITNPDIYQGFTQPYMDAYLDIRRRAGLKMSPIYYLGIGTGNFTDEARIAERLEQIRTFLDYARKKGIDEVYFHGSDEARGEELKMQRRMWRRVHEVGGKIFVACATGFFPLVGDLLDCPVINKESPEELPLVHKHGHKMHVYSNPPGAIEQPYTHRYHAGLWLVRSGMDGFHTYAYQHGAGPGKSMGRIWDDFDDHVYRAIAFAYPTVDGVIDTLQWEGLREGVDDVRYVTTLRKAIADAIDSNDAERVALAKRASAWLEGVSIEGDLQTLRREIVGHILALSGKGAGQ